MGDWADREYESGLIDRHGNLNSFGDTKYGYPHGTYRVLLTPSNFLADDNNPFVDNSSTKRHQIDRLDNENYELMIKHNRYNTYDNLALEVFYDEVFIGHIFKKHSNKDFIGCEKINQISFNNGIMNNLSLNKKNGEYLLTVNERKLDLSNDEDKVEKILYIDRKIDPLHSELETLQAVVSLPYFYNLTDDEILTIKRRINQLKLHNIGTSGRNVLNGATKGTILVLESSFKLVGSIIDLFKK